MKKKTKKKAKKSTPKKKAPEKKGGLVPLGDRVIIKPISTEEKMTKFGLLIPETSQKEKPETGKVVAVGEGKINDNGTRIRMSVKVGDTVLFSRYAPDEIKINGEDLFVLREDQILAIINK